MPTGEQDMVKTYPYITSSHGEHRASIMRLGLLTCLGTLYASFAFFTYQRQLPILCPWRRLTGHRCPLCGITTASGHVLHGKWRAAQRAYPLIIPVYVLTFLWLVRLIHRAAVTAPSPAVRRS